MRFFEFKLPELGSDFAKELESYLEKLIVSAKKLPETDPSRQQFDIALGKLQAEAGIKEDNIEDADTAIVSAIVSKLLKEGEKNALFAIMDLAKIVKDPNVQTALKNKESQISQQEKNKAQEFSKAKFEKAKAVAVKVGKPEVWGRDLLAILDRYENDQLANDFMDLVIKGKALTANVVSSQPILKLNLKSIINPKIAGIFDNAEVFANLALMPFAEQKAGFGGGVGPGEALLAMLIPKAKRAPGASDLEVQGKIWEVKGGGSETSKAWLDSATVAPAELRRIFTDETESLKPQLRKKIRYTDGSEYTLSQVLDLSDFREEKFKFLRTVFRYLDSSQHKSIINKMYERLFPNVKKKESKLYAKYVKDTINSILEGNRRIVADIQAKLGMLEYGLGSYQADNFIIYNYNTHELIAISGLEGIINSIDNKDNMVKTETITMGNSKKSSAGVTLISKPSKRSPKAYD
jgi:hypothetical protein